MSPPVSLENVSIRTPERVAILSDVSLTIAAGERWAMLGANGAGKSTLLSVLAAERHPTDGMASLLGERVGKTDLRELRKRIARVDGSQRMLDWLHAEEVVLTGIRNTIQPTWDDWTDADLDRARDVLRSIGADVAVGREMGTLSTGERQRVRIARALITRPELLLLDEPATGLDFPAREALLGSIDELAHARPDLTMVMVSHHLEELPTSITHGLLLRAGRVQSQGAIRDVLTSDRISTCFGFPITVTPIGDRWAAQASAGWSTRGSD